MRKFIPRLSVQLLTTLAILMALSFVLAKFRIQVTPGLRVSFEFLPNVLIGFFGGPFFAALLLGLADIINYSLNPMGGYLVLYGLAQMASGFLYGLFFYRRAIDTRKWQDWLYVTVATIVIAAFTNFGLIPLALEPLLKQNYWQQMFVGGRIFKIVEIPFHVVIFMFLLPQVQKLPEVKRLLRK